MHDFRNTTRALTETIDKHVPCANNKELIISETMAYQGGF